jgi:cobalt-zinc-cadmium efflux system outer membrane protein
MAAAGAVTHTTDAEIALAEADLRASVRQAFFGLVAAQERVSITAELLAIGERARAAADARVRAGEAARLELVQSELERARRENDAAAALGALDVARAELNTLLGRVPTATVRTEATLGEVIDVDAMLARLTSPHTNIEVAVLDGRVDEAAARLDLTRALGVPDPTVQATLTYRAPPDFTYGWRTGVSVTVPLFSRNTAPVARDRLALEHARALRNAGQQAADGRTSAAAARVRSLAAQQTREATVLMPRSLEVERMAEDAYRAGQIDLTALLQTLQTGRDVRLHALDTTLALQVAVADLERAAGVVLP